MARVWKLGLLLVVTASVLLGCTTPKELAPQRLAYYQNPQLTPWNVRRVALLPLENTTHVPHADTLLADAVANELQAAGLFEVVNLARHPNLVGASSVTLGHFDERILVDMANLYHADAVIVGRVSDYHSYFPQRVGLTLHIIGTHDASILASLNGAWDGSQAVGGDAKRHFALLEAFANTPHSGADLHSPRSFSAFVAKDVVEAIAANWHVGVPEISHSEVE